MQDNKRKLIAMLAIGAVSSAITASYGSEADIIVTPLDQEPKQKLSVMDRVRAINKIEEKKTLPSSSPTIFHTSQPSSGISVQNIISTFNKREEEKTPPSSPPTILPTPQQENQMKQKESTEEEVKELIGKIKKLEEKVKESEKREREWLKYASGMQEYTEKTVEYTNKAQKRVEEAQTERDEERKKREEEKKEFERERVQLDEKAKWWRDRTEVWRDRTGAREEEIKKLEEKVKESEKREREWLKYASGMQEYTEKTVEYTNKAQKRVEEAQTERDEEQKKREEEKKEFEKKISDMWTTVNMFGLEVINLQRKERELREDIALRTQKINQSQNTILSMNAKLNYYKQKTQQQVIEIGGLKNRLRYYGENSITYPGGLPPQAIYTMQDYPKVINEDTEFNDGYNLSTTPNPDPNSNLNTGQTLENPPPNNYTFPNSHSNLNPNSEPVIRAINEAVERNPGQETTQILNSLLENFTSESI